MSKKEIYTTTTYSFPEITMVVVIFAITFTYFPLIGPASAQEGILKCYFGFPQNNGEEEFRGHICPHKDINDPDKYGKTVGCFIGNFNGPKNVPKIQQVCVFEIKNEYSITKELFGGETCLSDQILKNISVPGQQEFTSGCICYTNLCNYNIDKIRRTIRNEGTTTSSMFSIPVVFALGISLLFPRNPQSSY